jgi:pimeloyl-ACP methyl ester carboxylesterase
MRIAVVAIASLLFCGNAPAQVTRDDYVARSGYRLHLRVHTPANPAVSMPVIVLESGGGFDAGQWSALQPELAAKFGAVVVAYDRAGFGTSDLPDVPYEIEREVRNLNAALVELELAGRLVFVAHSFGALLAQLYASLWPDAVAGLVFLDPNSPATMVALHDIQTRPFKEGPPVTQRERAFARIDAAIWDTLTRVYRAPIPQGIPLIVVSAEQGLFPEERQNTAFRLTHELIAVSVRDGRRVIAERSNHMIPAQRPDVVIESVADILSRARTP